MIPPCRLLSALALVLLLADASPPHAVIMKLTPLAEVLESEQFIFVAAVDKVDPDKPAAVFKFEKKLKGEAAVRPHPGEHDRRRRGQKKGDTRRPSSTASTRRARSSSSPASGARSTTRWRSSRARGSRSRAPSTTTTRRVRWAFLHGEPYLRRTFKGTTAEMMKVVEDGLAKKAKPPEPDEKEKPDTAPRRRARRQEGGRRN